MKEFINKYIQKNRYSIYSLFLALIFFYLTISKKNFYYNYLSSIVFYCVLSFFLIFSTYIKIKEEYFYVTAFLSFINSLVFFLLGRKTTAVRFLYFSILLTAFGFIVKYFYKFYEKIEKSGGKALINLGFLILSVIIIFSSVFSFIYYRNNINLSEKYYEEATHFYEGGDYYKAIDILHKSINNNKRNYKAYNLLGRSYLKIENFKESEKYLLRAISLKDNYFDPIIALGTAYERDNEFEKAINMYKKAEELRPGDFGVHFGLGRTYYKINDFEKSLDELLEAEKKISNNYELQYLLGSIYYKEGLFEKALKHFNLIKNKVIPKELKIEDGKKVEDFIEEITKKLEI
jgi:tetratricopeptide (TPR) repeat protein